VKYGVRNTFMCRSNTITDLLQIYWRQ